MESVKNSAFFYNFSAELKLQKILKWFMFTVNLKNKDGQQALFLYCKLVESKN